MPKIYILKWLTTLFIACFFYSGLFAQDSLHVNWNYNISKISDNDYKISVSGIMDKGWHIYNSSPEDELTGIKITEPEGSKISDFNITTKSQKITDKIFEKQLDVFVDSVKVNFNISFLDQVPPSLKLLLNYEAGTDSDFIPGEYKLSISLDSTSGNKTFSLLIPTIDLNKTLTNCGAESSSAVKQNKDSGLLNLFLLGFIGGLIALLTPCVFPMIPLTVSFFTKKAADRKKGIFHASLYGFFILLIYVLLSLPFHFLDSLNPEILNNISTNVYLNTFFFIIFIFFAFSFFGYYEITLPSSLSTKTDSKSGAGTVIGIFFMALTLALVSFSCTGPILGSLLAGSLSGDGGAMQLTTGMAGFGLALALPFALFALFPNWLNSLPKSGGWLNNVKVVLGFLELGLAFKFLSNADLVMHWGILKREIFIGIWVVVGLLLTLYLFGKIKFKHDSPVKKLPKLRIGLGVLTALFTLYLLPGLTNTSYANLKLISGFPPPLHYSIYAQKSDCLLGLNCTDDYEKGVQMAKEQNKLILLDFTGYACVNCRRMEENVWSDPAILELMKEKFIVVSLYVDDKKVLPLNKQFTYKTKDGAEREIVTVGNKWATFQTENFKNNSQPLYAILSTDEVLVNHPVGYTPSIKEYKSWLQCAVDYK